MLQGLQTPNNAPAIKRRKTDDENLPPYVSTFTEANVPQQE